MKSLKVVTATATAALLVAGCSQGSLLSRITGIERQSQQVEQQQPTQAGELLVALGDAAMTSNQPANAALYYSRAAESEPNNAYALASLGHAYLALRRFGQAEESFRRALAINPRQTYALFGLGKIAIEQDNPAQAATHFAQALSVAEGQNGAHRIYNGLGVALDLQNDHAGAQQAYRAGLDLAPGDLALRNNMALSLAAIGDYDQAVSLMESVARDANASARHRQNLAMIYGLAGRDEEALRTSMGDLAENQASANIAYYSRLRSAAESGSTE